MINIEKMIKWYKEQNDDCEWMNYEEVPTIFVAFMISRYAHEGQKRVNGKPYFSHPHAVFTSFVETFIQDSDDLDNEFLEAIGVPLAGVSELCLLHDVIENTDLELNDIKEVFEYFNLGDFFTECISEELDLLTRKESDNYSEYIEKLIDNPYASLVKLFDLYNNLDLFTLVDLNEDNEERSHLYLSSFYYINSIYDFVNKAHLYSIFHNYNTIEKKAFIKEIKKIHKRNRRNKLS